MTFPTQQLRLSMISDSLATANSRTQDLRRECHGPFLVTKL